MRFTVKRKLWAGFLSIILFLAGTGVLFYMTLPWISTQYDDLLDNQMEVVITMEQMSTLQNEISNDMRGYLLYKRIGYLKNRRELLDSFNERLELLEDRLTSKESLAIIEEIKQAAGSYEKLTETVINDFNVGRFEEAIGKAEEAELYQDIIIEKADEVIGNQRAEADRARQQLVKDMSMLGLVILAAVAVVALISALIAAYISRSITKPVQIVTHAIKRLATGDFSTGPLSIKNNDEIGDMAAAFNQMTDDLRGSISSTRDTANELAAQAEQLSASSQESLAASEMVAEIAEKNLMSSDMQSNIVKEASDSMKEMAGGINEIADNNEAMHASSTTVANLVEDGAAMMEEVATQMTIISETISESTGIINELADHSAAIRNVTGLITGIAEQTNLLALNAAIEAARAGEHGKGFAVVADEVRHLAEQSKQSAEEIGRMIETIIQNVTRAVDSTESGNERAQEGIGIARKANQVFEEIEKAANDVDDKVELVSAAIRNIRNTTEQVIEGAAKVQELAAQTAAEAQSTSAATEEQLASNQEISSSAHTLSEAAERLQANMAKFTI